MPTDTSEQGLETQIVRHMTGSDGLSVAQGGVAELAPPYGGTGYLAGSPRDYDRAYAIDTSLLEEKAVVRGTLADIDTEDELLEEE